LIIFYSGVKLILLGHIREYIGKVLMSINQFPQYSVKEHYSSEEKKETKRSH